jgi:hypothetical protein
MNVAVREADAPRTSAAAPMRAKQARPIIPPIQTFTWPDWSQTITGSLNVGLTVSTSSNPAAFPSLPPLPAAMYEIRRISGLTWDELAVIFGVNRRSLHYWANGGPVRPENALRIRCILYAMRQLNRRGATETRLTLLTPDTSGASPLDLFTQDRLDRAIAAFNATARVCAAPSIHPDMALARPTELMGALTDRPVPQTGAFIPGRSRRLPRRKP